MATVRGVMSAPTTGGTPEGAIAYYLTLVPAGIVPSSWKLPDGKVTSVTSPNGIYTITLLGIAGGGQGLLSWQDSTNKRTLEFEWTSSGVVTVLPHPFGQWSDPSLLQRIGGWIANGGTSLPILSPVPGQSQAGPETTNNLVHGFQSWTDLLHALGTIFEPAFWKRIGIGAAGVLILVIGTVVLLKNESPIGKALK